MYNFYVQEVEKYLKDKQKNDAEDVTDKVKELHALNSGKNISVDGKNKSTVETNCCELPFLIINEKCKTLVRYFFICYFYVSFIL